MMNYFENFHCVTGYTTSGGTTKCPSVSHRNFEKKEKYSLEVKDLL